jgi:hypothetical protein
MYLPERFFSLALVVVLAACSHPKQDLLTGKKWTTERMPPWGQESIEKEKFLTYIYEYKQDSTGVSEWMVPRIEWNNDTVLELQRDTFTYYRKGNSMFVKSKNDNRFQEQHIRELTDSTLVVEVPNEFREVFHYTARKQ